MRMFREKMDERVELVAGPFVSLTDPTASEVSVCHHPSQRPRPRAARTDSDHVHVI